MGQDSGCSCRDSGLLPFVHSDCWLCSFAAQRLCPKLFTYANTHSLTDARLCSHSQPHSHRDPKRSDADQSQSNADSDSNRDSDSNAAKLSRHACHPIAHAGACVSLTVITCSSFERIEACHS